MATTKINVKIQADDTKEAPLQGSDEEQQSQKGQKHIKVGNYDVNIDDDKLPLVGVAVSSVVLLIAVAIGQVHPKHLREYGYAIGIVALIISLIGLIPNDVIGRYGLYLNYALFIHCFVGACILTSGDGPFDETGNGYFASWALVVFSGMSMGLTHDVVPIHIRKITSGMNLILGLGASAILVLISVIPYFDNKKFYNNGESTLAVIVAVLTILVVANIAYAKYSNNVQIQQYEFPTLAVFAAFWTLTAILTTFRGPFLTTGNGYFATWAGAVCAVKATINSKNSQN